MGGVMLKKLPIFEIESDGIWPIKGGAWQYVCKFYKYLPVSCSPQKGGTNLERFFWVCKKSYRSNHHG